MNILLKKKWNDAFHFKILKVSTKKQDHSKFKCNKSLIEEKDAVGVDEVPLPSPLIGSFYLSFPRLNCLYKRVEMLNSVEKCWKYILLTCYKNLKHEYCSTLVVLRYCNSLIITTFRSMDASFIGTKQSYYKITWVFIVCFLIKHSRWPWSWSLLTSTSFKWPQDKGLKKKTRGARACCQDQLSHKEFKLYTLFMFVVPHTSFRGYTHISQ